MKIEIIEKDLSLLYQKAKQKFEECANDEENKFLKKEINISLIDIIIIEEDIKIVFSRRIFNQYLFEINLKLFEGQREIGKYTYIENEEGGDDTLVIY